MTNELVDDDAVIHQADDIAAMITKMLVEAFEKREGRRPTPDEVEELIEEITEERIEELLSGDSCQPASEAAEAHSSDEDLESGDEVDEEDEKEAEDAADSPSAPELSLKTGQGKGGVTRSSAAPAELEAALEERSEKRRRIASP